MLLLSLICGLPLPQIAGATVQVVTLADYAFPRLDGGCPEPLRTLTLKSIRKLPAFHPLLDALLPPAAPQLESLTIKDCWLDPASLHGCTQLCHLQEVALVQVHSDGGMGPVLAALLQQTPRLATLQVMNARDGTLLLNDVIDVLPHLCGCSGLTRLAFAGQLLTDLPDGSYHR